LFRLVNHQLAFNLEESVMIKHNSDPFLAQTSVMLVILLVMYVLGNDTSPIDHLLASR
jgi:hypothetical protein